MAELKEPQIRKCDVCNKEYQVNQKWQYTLCEDCYRKKAAQWGISALKEIYNLQKVTKEHAGLPLPPLHLMPVRKIDEELRSIKPHIRTCDSCHNTYSVNDDWPYVLCKKCTLNKSIEWENMVKSEVWGVDEDVGYLIGLPVPPMPLKRVDDVEHQITETDASRIQSHADKTGENEDFKRRAQSAAAKNQHSQ